MGILRDFERRLEGAVEGLFARAFRSEVQPVELGKRLVREVEDGRAVGVNRVYVPNVYTYELSPGDRERFADYEVALAQELAALAVDTARERGWGMLGPARIEFETGEDLEVGRFRLSSRVEADEQERDYAAAPAGPAAAQPVGPHTAMLPDHRPGRAVRHPPGRPGRLPQPRPGGARGRRLHRRGPPLHQRHRGQRPADPAAPPGQRRHAQAGQLDPPVPTGGLMPPIFLLAVKIAFLVILYLFVARAVRAVTLDVFGPRAERRRARPARAPTRPVPRSGGPGRPARRLPRELVVTDEGGRRTVPLKESLTVGRAATCDIAIRDTYVSNVHARIYQRDGSWWLEDLGSTNGTYMNRTRVQQPTAIGPGDEVKMGKATLELRR